MNIPREQDRRASVTATGIAVAFGEDIGESYWVANLGNEAAAKLAVWRSKKDKK